MAFRKAITLQLGLIVASVDLNSSIEKEAANHIVCVGSTETPHVATQVKQRTACPDCDNDGKDVGSEFEKVAASTEGAVLLSLEEIAAAKAEAVGDSNKKIELSWHPVEQVRTQNIPSGGVYFLTPSNPYVTQLVDHFKDAMLRNPQLAFLGTFSPQGRPNLYEFRLFGESIIMVQLARAEDVKVLNQPIGALIPAYQEVLAAVLATATEYDPQAYADGVKVRMAALAATKATAEGVVLSKSSSKSAAVAPVIDLAAQMQAQLAALTKPTKAKVTPIRKPRKKVA